MRVVGTLGQILGPARPDAEPEGRHRDRRTSLPAVKNAKAGQVQYRTDKAGIIHATIGRASFDVASAASQTWSALVDALQKANPAASQGRVPAQARTCRPPWAVACASITARWQPQ